MYNFTKDLAYDHNDQNSVQQSRYEDNNLPMCLIPLNGLHRCLILDLCSRSWSCVFIEGV